MSTGLKSLWNVRIRIILNYVGNRFIAPQGSNNIQNSEIRIAKSQMKGQNPVRNATVVTTTDRVILPNTIKENDQ
jgi:hypothetical protein